MGAPVRENGQVVGSLVVARETEDRAYTVAEREILVAFAKHASLALSDARTVTDAVHQALHDPLTGLPNRTLLLDRLGQAQVRAESAGSQVAVLFCDLDSFKTVNDSLGHVAGDELLIAVGARLLGCVRPGDTAARFGGDEFAVLIEDIEGVDVHQLAERILAALEEPFTVRGKEVFLSGSIGIATGGGGDVDLLRDADLAMYRAKRGGSGRHETFAPHMHASVVERLELEAELKRAILADQLGTHYQPILELPTGRLAGVEALVRWEHPTRGMMSPGEFIPIAEETGAIVSLGRAVLFDACSTVAGWQRAYPGPQPMSVSVNVSVLQLDQEGFIDEVREALRESRLAPGSLTLELTETAFSRDPEVMAAVLNELYELDVELAIDDFGTGFSSLQHLQHFPINMLKIPKPFIDDVGGPGRRLLADPRDHRHRRQPQPARRRGGDRAPGAARPPAGARLPLRPGLPARPPDDRRRDRGAARTGARAARARRPGDHRLSGPGRATGADACQNRRDELRPERRATPAPRHRP